MQRLAVVNGEERRPRKGAGSPRKGARGTECAHSRAQPAWLAPLTQLSERTARGSHIEPGRGRLRQHRRRALGEERCAEAAGCRARLEQRKSKEIPRCPRRAPKVARTAGRKIATAVAPGLIRSALSSTLVALSIAGRGCHSETDTCSSDRAARSTSVTRSISAGAAGLARRAGTSETRTPASSMSGRTTGSAGTCRRP